MKCGIWLLESVLSATYVYLYLLCKVALII